jgi:hypothetical protein
MKEIKEVNITGDRIYLTKSKLFGYKVVYPIRNEDRTINWKNLISGGSWIKLGIVILIVLIILGCVYEYSHAVKVANDCLNTTNLYSNKVFPITIK